MSVQAWPTWSQGPNWVRAGRVPCLDGLRGIAISLVVISHAIGTSGSPLTRSHPLWEPISLLGPLGVSIFFVISGFLITLLLLRERERSGAISVVGFYRRRAFRILPAYTVYLLVLGGLSAAGRIAMPPREWALALTYTSSLFNPHRWEIVHTWSLSIEEQFYLVWPLILGLAGRRAVIVAAVAAVVATVAGRFVVLLALPQYGWFIDYFTPTRLDCIAIGCLLAVCATDVRFIRLTQRWESRLAWLSVAALVWLVLWFLASTPGLASPFFAALGAANSYHALVIPIEVFKNVVVGTCVALLVWTVAHRPSGAIGRLLEAKPIVLLGVMSYSIYLWQQLFLNWEASGWMFSWPTNLWLSAAAAALSHIAIERPFLKLKFRTSAAVGASEAAASADALPAGRN